VGRTRGSAAVSNRFAVMSSVGEFDSDSDASALDEKCASLDSDGEGDAPSDDDGDLDAVITHLESVVRMSRAFGPAAGADDLSRFLARLRFADPAAHAWLTARPEAPPEFPAHALARQTYGLAEVFGGIRAASE
jgi:hypothetical protein